MAEESNLRVVIFRGNLRVNGEVGMLQRGMRVAEYASQNLPLDKGLF